MDANVTLRPITEADLSVLFEYYRDADSAAMAGFPARERDEFFAHRARIATDPSNETRAIVVGGEVAGDIGSWRQDGERRVGYWIGKQYWGRGIATAALKSFLAELTERPLYADVLKTNAGSIRVLQKCGFRLLTEDESGPDHDPEENTLRLDS
jgi:RimJ/RimL family protein N-acetyltransferase